MKRRTEKPILECLLARGLPVVIKYMRASGTVFERTGTHAIVITEIKEMKEMHLVIDGQ